MILYKVHKYRRVYGLNLMLAISMMFLSGCGDTVSTQEDENYLINSIDNIDITDTAVEDESDTTSGNTLETSNNIVEALPNELEFQYDAVLEGVIITAYNGSSDYVRFPSSINGDIVKDIIIPHSNLSYIEIPETVTNISEGAFKSCENLKTVKLSKNIKTIGKAAFTGCNSLTEIIMPDGLTTIGEGSLSYCSQLKYIDLPDSVTTIGEYAFYESGLEMIKIPSSVEIIQNYTFANNTYLNKVDIDYGVKIIGEEAFRGCAALKEIQIPESTTEIKALAFSECSTLSDVVLPNTIEIIGQQAFSDSNIYEIKLPSSLKNIDEGTFLSCENLTKVSIPSSVRCIRSSAFSNCILLTNVNIPDSIVELENSVFSGCKSLRSLDVPESVTILGNDIFQNCDALTVNYKGEKYNYSNFDDFYNSVRMAVTQNEINIEVQEFQRIMDEAAIDIANAVNTWLHSMTSDDQNSHALGGTNYGGNFGIVRFLTEDSFNTNFMKENYNNDFFHIDVILAWNQEYHNAYVTTVTIQTDDPRYYKDIIGIYNSDS